MTYEIKVCLVTISLHVTRMIHSTTMFRKAANKEGGVNEHKQTQSWRPREEDSDEVDECREEQYEQGRTACGGREFQKLNPSQTILIVFYVSGAELF